MEKIANGLNFTPNPDFCLVRKKDEVDFYPINKAPVVLTTPLLNTEPTVITLSTINEYVDPTNSYLSFQFSAKSGSVVGQTLDAGWLSLIDTIALKDKYGKEIDRVDRAHFLNPIMIRSQYGDDYLDNVDKYLIDSPSIHDPDRSAGLPALGTWTDRFTQVPSNTYDVQLPLSCLLGLFRTGTLLPPQLTDEMQIWIYWVDPAIALTAKLRDSELIVTNGSSGTFGNLNLIETAPFPEITLSDINIVLSTYQFDSELTMMMEEQYQEQGLVVQFRSYGFDSVHRSTSNLTNTLSETIPIVKSYTNATKIVTFPRIRAEGSLGTVTGSTSEGKYKNFIGVNIDYLRDQLREHRFLAGDSIQYHLNGTTYPNKPIDRIKRHVHHLRQAYGKNSYTVDNMGTAFINSMIYEGFDGPTMIQSIDRIVDLEPNTNPFLNGDGARYVSGQRIDGTRPVDIRLILQPRTEADVLQTVTPSYTNVGRKSLTSLQTQDCTLPTNMYWDVYVWVEHVRQLVVKPGTNLVLC